MLDPRGAAPALVCLAVMAVLATPAAAQQRAGLQLLAVPEGHPMLCRPFDGGAAAAASFDATVAREFLFDPPDASTLPPGFPILAPRTVVAVFDSAGRPLMMTDEVSSLFGGSEHVIALFPPEGSSVEGQHMRLAVDSAVVAAAIATGDVTRAQTAMQPPVSRDLTPEEGERAHSLANWLWPRRCSGA